METKYLYLILKKRMMKKQVLFLMLFFVAFLVSQAQVSINTSGNDPEASAMLDISSYSKGLLVPRMTSAQRRAIVSPASGLLVYDLDSSSFWYYKKSTATWIAMVGQAAYYLNDLRDVKADANSIFIGDEAGKNDDGTNWNVALGHESLRDNISGLNNSAFGFGTMAYNTTGNENTAIGTVALSLNTTGNTNVAVGFTAMAINSTGSENVAVGNRALLQPSSGNQNTAIGSGAGQHSRGGASGNVFIGYNAGKEESGNNKLYIENTDSSTPLIGGDFDTDKVNINAELFVRNSTTLNHTLLVGGNILGYSDLTINKNIYVDDSLTVTNAFKFLGGTPGEGKVLTSDLDGNASWADASSSGAEALNDLGDAKTYNTSVYLGSQAGMHSTGSQNVSLGASSLGHLTDGFYNVAIGYMAGYTDDLTAQDGNVFIGNYAGFNVTESNQLIIENEYGAIPLIHGSFEDDHLKINGTLEISGGNPGAGKVLTSDADGKASWETLDGGVTSLNDLSDAKNDNSTILIGSSGGADDGANNNTAMGISALNANTSGYNNVAFGASSLLSSSTGIENAAFGVNSMELSTSGSENVAIGSQALYNNAAGHQNTALGYMAGFGDFSSNSTGNVFLGYKAGYFETGSNKLYIDNSDTYAPLIYGDFDTDIITINGDINVNDNFIVNSSTIQARKDIVLSDNKNITYENVRTGKIQISGLEFEAHTSSSDESIYKIENSHSLLAMYAFGTGVDFEFNAPIKLPENVTLTKITLNIGGSENTDVNINIIKKTPAEIWGSGTSLFSSTLIFGESDFTTYSFDSFSEAIINNDNIYFINLEGVIDTEVSFGQGSFIISAATIEYEYTTLNH